MPIATIFLASSTVTIIDPTHNMPNALSNANSGTNWGDDGNAASTNVPNTTLNAISGTNDGDDSSDDNRDDDD